MKAEKTTKTEVPTAEVLAELVRRRNAGESFRSLDSLIPRSYQAYWRCAGARRKSDAAPKAAKPKAPKVKAAPAPAPAPVDPKAAKKARDRAYQKAKRAARKAARS